MSAAEELEGLRAAGLVAILRTATAEDARRAAEAAFAGGIRHLEVTFTVPEAALVIERLAVDLGPEVVVGAGTVTTTAQLGEALDAGARFVVSPGLVDDVVRDSVQADVLVLPGVLSPSEALRAVALGAPAVKLFPASAVGPGYVSALTAPLPGLAVVPSGGVRVAELPAWFAAGSAAVGLGGSLSPATVAPADMAAITREAATAVAVVAALLRPIHEENR